MSYTDDPIYDYDRYCDEQEENMRKHPVCCCCDKHIFDDFLFYIEGEIWCEECMLDEYRRPTDDFIKED